MSNYSVAQLHEIDEIDDGREPFRPVRHHFGITAFGVNAWTAKNAGDRIVNEHDEEGEDEELYIVQSGHARFEIDGEEVDAPAGSFVFVRPGARRTAFAEEPETTLIAVGSKPGEAYEPSGWELWAPLNKLYAAGEHAEAADRGRELAEANPQYAGLLYNLACVESLAGRTDDAIRDLGRAVELSERFRAFAAGDSDFDPIRDEPGFSELVGEKS
jgi:mannose-6-phosphate isomerase-like protein (cupin superfamily)